MEHVSKRSASRARRWAGALVLGAVLAALGAGVASRSTKATSRSPVGESRFEPVDLHPVGDFAHPAAGFPMPAKVGPFERDRLIQYDAEGRDLSAGYNAVLGEEAPLPVVATVYVYPTRPGAELDAYFESVLEVLREQHDGATPEYRKNILLADGRFVGRYATFGYAERWGGLETAVPLRSYLVLYQWNAWWVKWRVTTPAPNDDVRMKAIVELTESLLPPEAEPDAPQPASARPRAAERRRG
jgi:hypothetical protein